jgi:hypothetical protein
MANLMTANQQWSTRPDDERFASLHALAAFTGYQKSHSRASVVSSRKLTLQPANDAAHKGLQIVGPNGHPATLTNWAFGQLCQRAETPAGYVRKLPAPMAADCVNYGLGSLRDVEELGVMLHKNGEELPSLRSVNGPNYGRVWNADIAAMLVDRFGDGITGQWRVPGEFGKRVTVDKANTTLYASDRDMWVFLADEERRIELPNRRNGQSGTLARGFFVWNSEVGSATIGAAFFLFDYVCCNRIIWNVADYSEVRLRHTSGAPDRWLDRVQPVLDSFAHSSAAPVVETIEASRRQKVRGDLDKFLADRFGNGKVAAIKAAHEVEEGRPIETLWDVATGSTAYARTIPHQDLRVKIEREASKVLVAA